MGITIPWNCSACPEQFPTYDTMVIHREAEHPTWADENGPLDDAESEIVSVTGINPRCDICGAAQQPEDEWNGDTGNHVSCELVNAEEVTP